MTKKNVPFKGGHPSYQATFSLQKGCSYKRETTLYVSTSNDHVLIRGRQLYMLVHLMIMFL